jgi:pimeloyl-ACP methyl ester carboxylesterase
VDNRAVTRRRLPSGLVVVLVASACTFTRSTPRAFSPSLNPTECPGGIAAGVLASTVCGTLIVPAYHGDPSRGTLTVFVTRIGTDRPGRTPDPVLTFGGDMGVTSDYASFGEQAAGLGREVIVMDVRGTGHSQPSLLCPEIDALTVAPVEARVDARRTKAAFLGGVTACSERLGIQGIDPAVFDLREMAADAEDLRIALGVSSWNLLTIGDTSRIALEYVRDYPGSIRAVVLDSPAWPGVDPGEELAAGTRDAVNELVEACAEDAVCNRRAPGLGAAIDSLRHRLERHPVEERFGRRGSVTLDAGWFVLWLRSQLGFVRPPGTFIPGALVAMARADRRASRIEASRMLIHGNAIPEELCLMSFSNCWGDAVRAWGVNLSVLCRDVLPFRDPDVLASEIAGDPAMREAFGSDLIASSCGAWKAGASDRSIDAPVMTSVPILVISGRFDPFSTPVEARRAATTLTNATILVSPVSGHQVTGIKGSGLERANRACLVHVRDAWLDNLSASVDTSCLNRIPFDMWMPLDWERQF